VKRTVANSLVTTIAFAAAVAATDAGAAAHAETSRQIAAAALGQDVDLGRAPEAAAMGLTVILHYRHEDELASFVDQQSDPRSPLAHHVLTPAQFDSYFAPSNADYARLQKAFVRRGFTVARTFRNRTAIDVAGSAGAVERAFGTEIHAERRSDGTIRYANVRPAYLPSEMAAAVEGIVGFDTGEHRDASASDAPRGARLHPFVAPGPPLEGPATGFGPEAYARAYDMPDLHAIPGAPKGKTYDGTGVGVAIIASGDYFDYDLADYLKYFKISRTGPPTTRYSLDGGPPHSGGVFSLVTTLQVETLVGLSPGITLYDYGIPFESDRGILLADEAIVSDDTAAVALSPVFDCHGGTKPLDLPKLMDHLAMQGAALGIVFITSSGDALEESCIDGPQTPADAPHFVSVGGTILLIDAQAKYQLELGSGGSEGGLSSAFALPPYQQGVAGIRGTRRNVPDISFDGDPASGGALRQDGLWSGPDEIPNDQFSNELSAAIFTGMVAQWTQYHGAPLGDIHGTLYGAYTKYGYTKPAGAPIFHDITIGDSAGYRALPGYDLATGIGSIDGWNYAKALL
jgi:kumamolisin